MKYRPIPDLIKINAKILHPHALKRINPKTIVLGERIESIGRDSLPNDAITEKIYGSITIQDAQTNKGAIDSNFLYIMSITFANHQELYTEEQKADYKKYIKRNKKRILAFRDDEGFKKYLNENGML